MYQYTGIHNSDTICAIATASGAGAIAVIRLSGSSSIALAGSIFKPFGTENILEAESRKYIFGNIIDNDRIIDEVLLVKFTNPNSYTGEDVVEISCHGSTFIQKSILELLLKTGARLAEPGEFTFRAFLNRKLDLSQAEAVSDLIAAGSKNAHSLALKQLRGGYSDVMNTLREKLVNLASLLELELDFSDEDVEFADRSQLTGTMDKLAVELTKLLDSFSMGNAVKEGIPVVITGKPNVGKSTLLNALLREERAIVSDIPGTTRDTIEDVLHINGTAFRFIDTAGLRQHTSDAIETIGISRTYEKIRNAAIILYLIDMSTVTAQEIDELRKEFSEHIQDPDKHFILIGNKTDLMVESPVHVKDLFDLNTIFISAKRNENLNLLSDKLLEVVGNYDLTDQTIVSSARHQSAIERTLLALSGAREGIAAGLPTDLVAEHIREALHFLGEITGQVTNDEILGTIFSKFCIGK